MFIELPVLFDDSETDIDWEEMGIENPDAEEHFRPTLFRLDTIYRIEQYKKEPKSVLITDDGDSFIINKKYETLKATIKRKTGVK